MTSRIEIWSTANGVSIRSIRPRSWWLTIAAGALFAFVVCTILQRYLPFALALALALIGGTTLAAVQFSRTSVVLAIDKLSLTTRGRPWGNYPGDQSIPLADVRGLEYREMPGSRAGGLYVFRKYGATCVLPHLDSSACQLATGAIRARFPHIPNEPECGDSLVFTDDLIRLNLDSQR